MSSAARAASAPARAGSFQPRARRDGVRARAARRPGERSGNSRDDWDREKKLPILDVRRNDGNARAESANEREIQISKPDGASEDASRGTEEVKALEGSDGAGAEGVDALNSVTSSEEVGRTGDPFAAASDVATQRLRARLARVNGAGAKEGKTADDSQARELAKRFYEIECEASALEALEAQIEDAVETEDFASAASLKRAVDALRASDETGRLCDAYADAIANERFEEAVKLRDAGVGLCGWWAGVEERSATAEDADASPATGVIMRISREHGRLVGATYSSRDLADIVELNKAYPEGYDYEAGQPVMEIILREDESTPSGYRRDVVRLNYVPVTIPLAGDEDEDEDTEEDVASALEGVGFVAASSGTESALRAIEEAASSLRDSEDLDSVKEEIKASLLGLDPTSGKPRDEALEEVGAMLDKFNDVLAAEEAEDDDDEETLYDVTRTSASLQEEGRHAFILTSDDEIISLDDDEEDNRPFSRALDKEIEGFLASKWESMVPNSESPSANALGAGSHAALVNAVKEAAQEMFARHDHEVVDEEVDVEDYFREIGDDEEIEDGDEVSAEELLAIIGQEDVLHRPLPNRVRFQRIDPSLASGLRKDIFDRLYIGAFGPHGPEVLRLVRGRWGDDVGDSNDCVTAIKLTGDENVPCGAASFRAKVNKANLITEGGSYPDELGVMARYKGEGRVAKPGFTESHWVEGELLVLNGKGGSLTGGAELGFVWAVPGERRLLILFSSLVLPEVEIGGGPR